MILRPFLFEETGCASYLAGCGTAGLFAVVDPHIELVERYLETAKRLGGSIAAVLETHVQADHLSGLPALVEATGARAILPAGSGASFPHEALADGERLQLGNTGVQVLSTPGHAPAHNAYLITDARRTAAEPWLVFTGDCLLIADVGRPDLHGDGAPEQLARALRRSLDRLLALPDHLLVYPSHFGGSVCGRGLSGHPVSTIGFERRHNRILGIADEDAFVEALLTDVPPPPPDHERLVAANRAGTSQAPASS